MSSPNHFFPYAAAAAARQTVLIAEEEVVNVKVAMGSGACDNVINPDNMPAGAAPSGNPTGKMSLYDLMELLLVTLEI